MVEYLVGDALEYLRGEPDESADLIHLDDAWARPARHGGQGVTYSTHPMDEDDADLVDGEPGVDTSLTVAEFIDAARATLRSGGLLAMDTDSYLLPRVIDYLSKSWSDHCYFTYTVTLLTTDGKPDRSTPGMYGSTGGYTMVLATKDATPIPQTHPVEDFHIRGCPCQRQREDFGWGTVKPLAPHLDIVETYTDEKSRIIVPCAGTAPTAIAAERVYGPDARVTAVDIEQEAKAAYQRRQEEELQWQSGLSEWG